MDARRLTLITQSPERRAERRATRAAFYDLDRVRVLADIEADEGVMVPAGSIGTVVATWADGQAFEVEFTRSVDGLGTIPPNLLELVESASD